MNRLVRFWDSTVGKKIVMGLTGIVLVGFVLVHMAGNLQVFLGPEKFNGYSHFLQHDVIEFTWVLRAALLVAVVLHVTAAVQLTLRNRAARPAPYAMREPQVSTWASRTMRWGGAYLLAFIPYHLMHFTLGWVHPAFVKDQAYGNVMIGFQVTWVVFFYLGAMLFLGLHLYHGVWAMFRTLGVARPSNEPMQRTFALVVAIVVAVGFSLVPLSVALGFVR
jgi:succinate dehydrogenase / fumarate reductase cytochrome b subunit